MHLIDNVPENSVAWLLLSSIFAVCASYLTYHFITKKEIQERIEREVEAEYKKQISIKKAEAEASKQERIRSELARWSNPLQAAVDNLYFRLDNLLNQQAYLALSEKNADQIDPNWSIDYDYFLNSTLYLFAHYVAWIDLFEKELSIELFKSYDEKEKLLESIRVVRSCLSSYPTKYNCYGKDVQVFSLQQRAIAELLIISENGSKGCMKYPEFLKNLKKDDDFRYHFKPLQALIEDITPDGDCRWKRLEATMNALRELRETMMDLGILARTP